MLNMIECALAYYSNCPRAVRPTLFEEFLSFLVSKFVKLCQNDGDPVKGGAEYRVNSFRSSFFLFSGIALLHLFYLFFFHSIFDSLHERGRRDCRAFAHCYCLFAHARSFPNRVFPAREIANRYRSSAIDVA